MKLSKRVQSLAESATLAVTAKAAKMKADGIDVIGFGAGEPDFPTPPHIIEAAGKAMEEGHTKYPKPASGLPAIKEAVCAKLRRENGLQYDPDQIVVTVGGKNACALVLNAMIDPGDEVLVPVPYWVSYPEMIKLAGGVPVFVRAKDKTGFRLAPDDIRGAITDRTRVLLMNYPSNPSGHMYSPDQVRAIAKATGEADLTVVSDEIYDRLVYGGREFLSFGAAGDDVYRRTITINSASKTYSMTGWRLGFVAGPVDVIKAVAKLQSQGTSGGVTFAQLAYAAALNGDQSCVEKMRDAFAKRARYTFERLNAMPGVRCAEPEGAFYTFPDVSETYARLGVASSVAFAEKLLTEARIAVVPGVAFGMDANVRISFATGMPQIEEGLSRLSDLLQRGA